MAGRMPTRRFVERERLYGEGAPSKAEAKEEQRLDRIADAAREQARRDARARGEFVPTYEMEWGTRDLRWRIRRMPDSGEITVTEYSEGVWRVQTPNVAYWGEQMLEAAKDAIEVEKAAWVKDVLWLKGKARNTEPPF
jgi:hypothetical protein